MNWNISIGSIVTPAAEKVGLLYCSREFFPHEDVVATYKSNIRSFTEYCNHMWSSKNGDKFDKNASLSKTKNTPQQKTNKPQNN